MVEIRENMRVRATADCSDGMFKAGEEGVAIFQGGCGAWWVQFDGPCGLCPVNPDNLEKVK